MKFDRDIARHMYLILGQRGALRLDFELTEGPGKIYFLLIPQGPGTARAWQCNGRVPVQSIHDLLAHVAHKLHILGKERLALTVLGRAPEV